MIKEEMDLIRRDLAIASCFPDEEILSYTFRRIPPTDWPVYSVSGQAVERHILQWVSPDNRVFNYRLALTQEKPKTSLVRDHMPCLEAFHLAKYAKNISYRIALVLAGIAISILLASAVTNIRAPITFVLCYIFMSLSIEAGLITLLFLNKQRQVEEKLWPLTLSQHFLFGRDLLVMHASVSKPERCHSQKLEAYKLARAAKYTSLFIGLILVTASFAFFVGLTWAAKPFSVIFVPCYICLSLAVEGGLVGILFDSKMRDIRKQIHPQSFPDIAPYGLEEVEAIPTNA